MASIRPKGKAWEVRYYAGRDHDGRPIRRSKIVQGTYRAAQAQADLLEGRYGEAPMALTFGRVIETWLAHGGRRTEVSQRSARQRMRTHAIGALGTLPVTRVTPAVLEGFYQQLRDAGLAEGTIRNIHWDLSGALRRAVRDGIIERNPAEIVEFAPRERRRMVPPSLDDVRHLLATIDGVDTFGARETALAVRLAVSTGARLGEVCGLRWGDVDFERAAIQVVRTVVIVRPRLVVKETKTGNRRRVAVPPAVIDRLAAHRNGLDVRLPKGSQAYVLQGDDPGEPQSPDVLSHRFRTYRKAAGLGFRFHDLRHLTASMWLADMPTLDASAAIGHRRTSTTTDIYGHLLEDAETDRRTADAVARRIDL